jgi:AcrR family transcriptional regulator
MSLARTASHATYTEVMTAALSGEGASEPLTRARPKKRRSSVVLRELITDAARDLFASRGYQATTTRDIALEAGVNEPTIYRHFGSKPKLFEAAVVQPYHEFMTDFMTQWTRNNLEPQTGEEVVRNFVVGLYDALSANRNLILAFTCAEYFDAGELGRSGEESIVSRELRAMDDWARRTSAQLEFHDIDIPVTLRCSFAMVMGLVLHDNMLFEQGTKHPTRARIIRELTTYMYRALSTRRIELGPDKDLESRQAKE